MLVPALYCPQSRSSALACKVFILEHFVFPDWRGSQIEETRIVIRRVGKDVTALCAVILETTARQAINTSS